MSSHDSTGDLFAPAQRATEIPGARLAVIPAAGHLSNLEQPEVFNDLVRNFVEELRAAGD